ncbi:MAG: hypothetical protein Q4F57_02740 [Weeksellaceae bacterium]|nr:hypothetical protein [Weeksellaceae bacterium]
MEIISDFNANLIFLTETNSALGSKLVISESAVLGQLYIYHQFYVATKTALLYHSSDFLVTKSNNFSPTEVTSVSSNECKVIQLQTDKHLKIWQETIKSVMQDPRMTISIYI